MSHTRNIDLILKYAVSLVMLAMLAFQVMAQRGLFADGSFQLLNLLVAENFRATHASAPDLFRELITRNNEPMRFFALVLTELPTVIALRLGITNMDFLIYIFSSWLQFMPLLFWGLALWRVRNNFLFWAFLMMFTAVYFNGGFFSIGEYNLAYGLTACCTAFILKSENNTRTESVLLFLMAIATVMSYGSTMLTGPLLCILAIRQFLRAATRWKKLYWIALVLIFLISAAVGLWSYVYTQIPESLQNARDTRGLYYNHQFWFTVIYSALIAAHILTGKKEWRGFQCYALLAFCFIFFIVPLNASPFLGFEVRAFTGVVFLIFLITISLLSLYGERCIPALKNIRKSLPTESVIPVFALFLMLSALDIQGSIEFRTYLDNCSQMVNTHTGLLRYEDSFMLVRNNDLYGWPWTHPTLGLLLRKNDKAAIILEPWFQKGRWEPFDPRSSVPDLSRYYPKT